MRLREGFEVWDPNAKSCFGAENSFHDRSQSLLLYIFLMARDCSRHSSDRDYNEELLVRLANIPRWRQLQMWHVPFARDEFSDYTWWCWLWWWSTRADIFNYIRMSWKEPVRKQTLVDLQIRLTALIILAYHQYYILAYLDIKRSFSKSGSNLNSFNATKSPRQRARHTWKTIHKNSCKYEKI